jgi:hypothetical protein
MPREKPIVGALLAFERSLTRLEDVIDRLAAVVAESSRGVEEIRSRAFEVLDQHGAQLRRQEELVIAHEAELYQRRGGPRQSDAE